MKPPPFLANLYADLRDRRLLPVVGVLLVAIVAVPLALKRETQPPPLDANALAAVEGAEVPTLPAVLASDPGLRDYRERLDAMRSKNPFRQDFEAPAIADAAIASAALADVGATVGASSDSVPEPTAPSGSDSTSSGSTTSPASPQTSTASVASSSSGTGSKSSSKSEGEIKTKTKEVKVAYRVDLQVGLVGEAKRRKNVKALTALPSESSPVMVFIGAGEDGKQAVFLLSEDVGQTEGDGSCLPDAGDCQFLSLKPGQERRLVYGSGPESKEYVIKLVEIKLAPITKDSKRSEPEDSDEGGTEDEDSDTALSGIEAWLGL